MVTSTGADSVISPICVYVCMYVCMRYVCMYFRLKYAPSITLTVVHSRPKTHPFLTSFSSIHFCFFQDCLLRNWTRTGLTVRFYD